jgi:hypothetical protein
MNSNVWLPILTGALVLVSAYYALTIRKLLATNREMVSATKEMVEAAWKTYALSVMPQVECRTVTCTNSEPQPSGEPPRPFVAKTTITNHGPHRLRLKSVRVETESEGEQVRRFVDRWLVARESETVRVPLRNPGHIKVLVHFDDIANQDHVVLSELTASE